MDCVKVEERTYWFLKKFTVVYNIARYKIAVAVVGMLSLTKVLINITQSRAITNERLAC